MAKDPIRVLVIGAAGQMGYALVHMIARGGMLGPKQPVILHMLDIPPAAESLNGILKELSDAAFPLLKGVVATTDAVEACTGVNIAIMLYGFQEKEGMEKKEVISENVSLYKSLASALEKHAAANCKVLVVANPANTNALILKEFTASIPDKNVTFFTGLDDNKALGQMSETLDIQDSDEGIRDKVLRGIAVVGIGLAAVGIAWAAVVGGRKLFGLIGPAIALGGKVCEVIGTWSDDSEEKRKTMKAPGRDSRIFRDDFERNPAGYFRDLRNRK